jgi:alpha-L-fucosidase 2
MDHTHQKAMKNTLKLIYPAAWWAGRWRDALPSGNGTVGAAVYGSVWQETVLLTHEDLWCHHKPQVMPDVSDRLPEVRRLLLAGKIAEAEPLISNALKGKGYRHAGAAPMPLGDLKIGMPSHKGFKDYSRSLDMETGEVSVAWRDGDTCFERRLFVSRTDDLLVCEMTSGSLSGAGKPGLTASINLDIHDRTDALKPFGHPPAPLPEQAETHARDGMVSYAARNDDGADFGAVVKVVQEGGSQTCAGGTLTVSGAGKVTLYLKVFIKEPRLTAWERLAAELAQKQSSYAGLLKAHAAVHGSLFHSAELDLGAAPASRALSNEELLLEAYQGEAPLALVEKLWAYGRYLLISSSRPGGQPCTLQGLWGGEYDGFWSFNMANENIQMIYWQALSGNMPELLLAVFDYYDRMMEDFRTNARCLYGCRGIYIPADTTPMTGLLQDLQPHIIHFTGAAGWLGQHYYDYYLYTRDEQFLRERALPFLHEVALFYADFFFLGEDGYYISAPSQSPENTPGNYTRPGTYEGIKTTINATLDFAIAKEALTHLVEGAVKTGMYPDEVIQWKEMLTHIPPYQVNEDGAVKEWMHPFFKDNYHHRHQSHLYPVFPGVEITQEDNPELFQAFVTAVKKRLVIGLSEQSSWSNAHMACNYARMGEGDLALECLDILSRAALMNNFFTVHNDWRQMGLSLELPWAPFQIDANMGVTAAVQEMLLFSRSGFIKLLPALPRKWCKGSMRGLACRGGVTVDQAWDMEAGWLRARLCALVDQVVQIKAPAAIRAVKVNGQAYLAFHDRVLEGLELVKGKDYNLDITCAPRGGS